MIYYTFLIVCSQLHGWEQELTTDVVQRYYPPNSLLREAEKEGWGVQPVKICKNFFLKYDASRIIGAKRLKDAIIDDRYENFKVPEKFLIPVLNEHQEIDIDASKIISMHVHGMYPKSLGDEPVQKLLSLTATGVADFAHRNMLQDEEKKIWFIDTQIALSCDPKRHFINSILLIDDVTFNLSSGFRSTLLPLKWGKSIDTQLSDCE